MRPAPRLLFLREHSGFSELPQPLFPPLPCTRNKAEGSLHQSLSPPRKKPRAFCRKVPSLSAQSAGSSFCYIYLHLCYTETYQTVPATCVIKYMQATHYFCRRKKEPGLHANTNKTGDTENSSASQFSIGTTREKPECADCPRNLREEFFIHKRHEALRLPGRRLRTRRKREKPFHLESFSS